MNRRVDRSGGQCSTSPRPDRMRVRYTAESIVLLWHGAASFSPVRVRGVKSSGGGLTLPGPPRPPPYMTPKSATSTSTAKKAASTSSPPTQHWANVLCWDLENELKTTRRFLERVPDGKDDWRPHAKSKSLDELATHI